MHQRSHQKYYAGIQNACLQCVERQGVLQNFKHFSSLQKSYFSNIKELTHKIKTAPKVVLKFFKIEKENVSNEITLSVQRRRT